MLSYHDLMLSMLDAEGAFSCSDIADYVEGHVCVQNGTSVLQGKSNYRYLEHTLFLSAVTLTGWRDSTTSCSPIS